MSPPIQALVFDAYGTLFDPHSVQAACERIFPGAGAALSQTWRTNQLEYTWLRSLMNRYEDFWRVTGEALEFSCRSLRLPYEREQLSQLMQEYLKLEVFPDVRETLRALSGRRLLILSNGSPAMLKALVEHAGLASAFSDLVSVHTARIYKPAPAVYQLAVERTGAAKEAIGFVSSNSWDIAGAASFGFQIFWINRSGNPPAQLGIEPGAILGSLTQLARLCEASR